MEGFKYELETEARPKTVEYYIDHARIFIRWAQDGGQISDPRLLTKRDIQTFFHYLTDNHVVVIKGNGARREINRTERTRWPYYRSLKRFLNWVKQEGYLKENPIDQIKLAEPKPTPIDPYHPEHISRMLKVLDHDWKVASTARQRMLAARDRAVLLLFLESGLRLSELTSLQIQDIDLQRQRVLVTQGKMGKGRLAGFGPDTKKALWRYLGLRQTDFDTSALWLTEEGHPLSKTGVSQIIRRLKKDAGLQHLKGSVHKLRHTFATTYLKHTHDMKGCRLLLGQSTLAMVERYTQFIEAEDALVAYDHHGPLQWLIGKQEC